jgi:hypothetical protein
VKTPRLDSLKKIVLYSIDFDCLEVLSSSISFISRTEFSQFPFALSFHTASASSRRNQPFGFMSKLRHWTNGLQRRMAPVDGIGGLVSVGLGGRLCIIMGGWFE